MVKFHRKDGTVRNLTKHICKYCGKEFMAYASMHRKFCSRGCARIAEGIKRQKREPIECPVCHKLFIARSSSKRKYCSRECFGFQNRKPDNEKAKPKPSPPRSIKCVMCGQIKMNNVATLNNKSERHVNTKENNNG